MDKLAFLDLNPIHIGIVLLLALILFGPKRLPEVGRELGKALRDLKKAGNDMMNSFNTDHEPDYRPYEYNYPTPDEHAISTGSTLDHTPGSPDLTDYTIVGQPVRDPSAEASNGHGTAHEVTSVTPSESAALAAESGKEGSQ